MMSNNISFSYIDN